MMDAARRQPNGGRTRAVHGDVGTTDMGSIELVLIGRTGLSPCGESSAEARGKKCTHEFAAAASKCTARAR